MIRSDEDWLEFLCDVIALPETGYGEMIRSEVRNVLAIEERRKEPRCTRIGRRQRVARRYRQALNKKLL